MRKKERGTALILALILVFILSILGISVMFVAQTETWSSMNYRLMTQARYGAEAGLNRSLDYLVNTYVPPASTGSDLISSYNITPSQPVSGLPSGINQVAVSYSSKAVILSGSTSVSSNYPVAAVQTAYHSAASGTITAGSTTITYNAYATLLSMNSAGVQIWQITSDGTISGVRNADVEVQAVLERQSGTTTFNYAAFSTNNGCGSMNFSGGTAVNSYNSAAMTCSKGSPPTCSGGHLIYATTGGNVGTNGNLTVSGSATIDGTLSTPRSGVGSCSSGGVDALTSGGGATVTGGEILLPQAVSDPAPVIPTPAPPTTNVSISGGSSATYTPGTYGNISVSGGATLHISAGTYNLNSISLSGGALLTVDSGPVILNITGASQATPINFSGGTISNASLDSSQLVLNYAGSGSVNLSGGASSAAVLDAPNASLTFSGGTDFYGAVICAKLVDSGSATIHFDTNLLTKFSTSGNWMLDSFTWKKY
jgi:Tfp pilus assembly protein PilX